MDALAALAFLDHQLVFRARLDVTAHRRLNLSHLRTQFAQALHVLARYARLQPPSPPEVPDPGETTREDVLHALGALDKTIYETRLCVQRRDLTAPALAALCVAFETAVAAIHAHPPLSHRTLPQPPAATPDGAAGPGGQHEPNPGSGSC